jgi:hypothetical protein
MRLRPASIVASVEALADVAARLVALLLLRWRVCAAPSLERRRPPRHKAQTKIEVRFNISPSLS